MQRDIKLRLLPSGYQEKLAALEQDYKVMPSIKFLSKTQKIERIEKMKGKRPRRSARIAPALRPLQTRGYPRRSIQNAWRKIQV